MRSTEDEGSNFMRLVVDSSYSELESVINQALSFFASHTDNMDVIHKVMLLTSEAVTNGMKHGNQLDKNKSVVIDFMCHENSFEVWVEDEGNGFDRDAIPDPLSSEHLMDEGGRGIFLIEKMADEVNYEKGGRRVGMVFNLEATDKE
ncbi:MAG: ATP-binding protein [Bacteroidetes bacterium]|nr:ATP-binding protein [Bacteroidota bacterium]